MAKGNLQKPLVIIGPSGAGKSTIVRELVNSKIIQVHPTWTTRPPRPHEKTESIEHIFVTEIEFDEMVRKKQFLRVVRMFNLPYRYGLTTLDFYQNKVTAVILRASLIKEFDKFYPERIVYQILCKKERIVSLLNNREISGEKAGARLNEYDREMPLGCKLANRSFINNNLKETLEDIERSIIVDFRN